MSLTPQFSDALASHFPTSSSSSRSSSAGAPFVYSSSQAVESESGDQPIVDRRRGDSSARNGRGGGGRSGVERRQFGSSHAGLSREGRELAAAIDAYKLEHRRRYITCDEMLVVLTSLGYSQANR